MSDRLVPVPRHQVDPAVLVEPVQRELRIDAHNLLQREMSNRDLSSGSHPHESVTAL